MKTTILSILLIFASFSVKAIDYALQFNGYNDVKIPYDVATTQAFDYLNGANVYTIEAWVKPTSATVGGEIIVRRTDQFSITLYRDASPSTEAADTDGKRRFYFTINGSANKYYNTTDNCINLNQWNHIAVVNDGTTIKLYANGVDVTLGTNPAMVALTTQATSSFFVALMGTTTPLGFEGYMDKIRISKEAIDLANFQTSITSTPYTTDADAIVLMNFTEGTGTTTANDATNAGSGIFEHSTTVADVSLQIDPVWTDISTTTKICSPKTSNFNVFPNPIINNAVIITQKDNSLIKQVRITDLSGKQIISVVYNSNEPIEVKTENLEKGIYLFQIEGVDYKETRQIIKN